MVRVSYFSFRCGIDVRFLVWIVSTEQLLAWVRDPTPVGQLDGFDALRCSTPDVQENICNGMPEREKGLLAHCPFSEFPFFTCVSRAHTSGYT